MTMEDHIIGRDYGDISETPLCVWYIFVFFDNASYEALARDLTPEEFTDAPKCRLRVKSHECSPECEKYLPIESQERLYAVEAIRDLYIRILLNRGISNPTPEDFSKLNQELLGPYARKRNPDDEGLK